MRHILELGAGTGVQFAKPARQHSSAYNVEEEEQEKEEEAF